MAETQTPLSGFTDTFLSKLKEQSFTIVLMIGIIWYQGKMMEERVTYWQRDKYVEDALNELKTK